MNSQEQSNGKKARAPYKRFTPEDIQTIITEVDVATSDALGFESAAAKLNRPIKAVALKYSKIKESVIAKKQVHKEKVQKQTAESLRKERIRNLSDALIELNVSHVIDMSSSMINITEQIVDLKISSIEL